MKNLERFRDELVKEIQDYLGLDALGLHLPRSQSGLSEIIDRHIAAAGLAPKPAYFTPADSGYHTVAPAHLNPHYFEGRTDRACESCNYPDSNPIHIRHRFTSRANPSLFRRETREHREAVQKGLQRILNHSASSHGLLDSLLTEIRFLRDFLERSNTKP